MNIISCSGFECEKKLPTTLEDLFNQSDVVYEINQSKKHLNVTYVRYFDTYLLEQNIYDTEKTGIPFYHICALLILLKQGTVDAQRLYYNDTQKFLRAFNPADIDKVLNIYRQVSHVTS